MVKVKAKWLASLSDGSTAIEGEGLFAIVTNEPSPWQKLTAHLEAAGLHITHMRIQVSRPGEATRTYNLPSQRTTPEGTHERWVSLYPIIPERYNYWRWVTGSLGADGGDEEGHEIEIRAYFADYPDISLIVDENEGTECWVVFHEKKAKKKN